MLIVYTGACPICGNIDNKAKLESDWMEDIYWYKVTCGNKTCRHIWEVGENGE